MIKNKYELASKPERDRIIGNSFIGSYGPFPVHNVKFNKLVQYLEKINNNSQVSDESEYQKALKDTIKMQLNLSRLKILNDYALKEKEAGFGSDVLAGLSFRNWCGMSSPIYDNIKNDLDDPNRMFAIDKICRDHDIRYTQAKYRIEQKEADNIMIEEIYNEYVLNFNRNFLTGNYKSDFTTWTSSFKTVFNYLMTGIETAYVGKLTQATLKTAYQVAKLPYDYIVASNPLPEYKVGYFKGMSKMVSELGDIESQGEPYVQSAVNMFKDVYMNRPQREIPSKLQMLKMRLKSGVSTLALTFVATSLIKDRIFALGSLAAITLKKMIETVTNYRFVDLTKHEVSDEDLENIIKVFETLQNQYLQESGLDPIKIGDDWTKEQIEVPPIKEIEEDIKIIAEQNKTYNELNKTMVEAIVSEPVQEPTQEPIQEPTQVYDYEPLTEEELKRLKIYQELNDYFDKILSETNLIISPYPDLPESLLQGEDVKEKLVPDIEKDIKDATPSSLLDLPDEENIKDEMFEQPEKNNQEKNDEKNKTEL
jgi:hypothetical protein